MGIPESLDNLKYFNVLKKCQAVSECLYCKH